MPKPFYLYVEYKNQKYPCELVPKRHNRNIRIRIAKITEPSTMSMEKNMIPAGENQLDMFQTPVGLVCVVKVSYPPRLSRRQVVATLNESAAWIATHFEKMQKVQQQAKPTLKTGTKILFQGKRLTLVFLPTTLRKQKVFLEGDRLLCAIVSTQQQKIKKAIEQWYREQAVHTIADRIGCLIPGMTRKTYRIRIAGQKTQWGSCSAAGVLSFNWKLMMAPKYVLDYIIIHELAHLEEMNHSQRFWNLVRTHCKFVDKAKVWLKQHGARLDTI
jgi:predicted metal-dependent hydrolase